MNDPTFNLVEYISRLNLSQEQHDGLCERIFDNVEAVYENGFQEAVRKCRALMGRYLDTITDESEKSAISAAVEDMEGTEITIVRTDAEITAMKHVSDYVRSLPLASEQNNRLVELLTDMQRIISEEQFINGMTIGSRALGIEDTRA
jgi:hypothetical protein